ncbi:MAG: hypothetical protein RLZZ58_883, partial [Pseudomonadota bacterium]
GIAFLIAQFIEGPKRAFRYRLDLKTRVVTAEVPPAIDLSNRNDGEPYDVRVALDNLAGTDDRAAWSEIGKALLPLPKSHDGTKTLFRTNTGMEQTRIRIIENPVIHTDAAGNVSTTGNQALSRLAMTAPPVADRGVSLLAPDGGRLAYAQMISDGQTSQILFDNLLQGEAYPLFEADGRYDQVAWLTPSAVLFTRSSLQAYGQRDVAASTGRTFDPAQPAIIVNLSDNTQFKFASRCTMAVGRGFDVYGAGAPGCVPGDKAHAGLERFDFDASKWEPFGQMKLPTGLHIEGLSVSPEGYTVAVSLGGSNGIVAVVALDSETGVIVGTRRFDRPILGGEISMVGEYEVVISDELATTLYALDDARMTVLDAQPIQQMVIAGDGRTVAIGDAAGVGIRLFDVATGAALRTLDFSSPQAGGFLPDRNLFWALSPSEGLRYWNATDWTVVASTYFPDLNTFVTATPEGWYDTNVEADNASFRWLMADAPDQSLAPSTFMRDYFRPGLLEKLIKCSALDNCKAAMGAPKPIAKLNRVLPLVTINSVTAGDAPDIARVELTIEDKSKAGVFNVQLFRQGRFAGFVPDRDFDADAVQDDDIAVWRRANRLVDDDDKPGDGIIHQIIDVPLDPGGASEQEISAYAFNSDRVKSVTNSIIYELPPQTPRVPRAFVIAIGIDAYDESRLNLDYAAKDARLMGRELARIEGYDTRTLVVAGSKLRGNRRGSDAEPPRVTAAVIADILAILAGDSTAGPRDRLKAANVDASMLDTAWPDDVVIISFSGHGWADEKGNFFLVPADGNWPAGKDKPIGGLIASWELAGWLRYIQADQIALILDTCHSGASLQAERFRPGPMGDSGLAQLAYDKGIQILAATQASDVAYEDKRLKHGLLTYVLAGPGEALSETGAKRADTDADGAVKLDEWLAYAVARLPELNDSKKITGTADGDDGLTARAFLFPGRKATPAQRIQQPSLFSYLPAYAVMARTTPVVETSAAETSTATVTEAALAPAPAPPTAPSAARTTTP